MAEGQTAREYVVLALDDVAADAQLDTLVGHLTDVPHLAGIAHRQQVLLVEQVAGGVPVNLGRDGQSSVEQRDVGSQVAGDGGLPLDFVVVELIVIVVSIVLLAQRGYFTKARAT